MCQAQYVNGPIRAFDIIEEKPSYMVLYIEVFPHYELEWVYKAPQISGVSTEKKLCDPLEARHTGEELKDLRL